MTSNCLPRDIILKEGEHYVSIEIQSSLVPLVKTLAISNIRYIQNITRHIDDSHFSDINNPSEPDDNFEQAGLVIDSTSLM